jgi:hypothetical protein
MSSARFSTLFAALLALASLACFAYPLYVIRPFRHQGARELAAALLVAQIGPWLSIFCAVACVVIVIYAWSRLRGWIRRTAAVLCIGIAALGALLARFNIYEQMFHPLRTAQFEPADRAHIDPDDMVLAVRVNRAARAYPIREIAYHHIVNDAVGGVPIVATY